MSLSVELIKTPGEISFSGNPMSFIFALAPYGSTEKSQDIRLSVRVELEDLFGSNVFNEKRNQVYYPDNDGKIQIDISSIIDPYLEYFIPRITLGRPVAAADQRKRYRIVYVLQKDNIIVGNAETSAILSVMKGGTSYETMYSQLFFDQHVVTNKKPLLFSIPDEKTGVEELRFLFWSYPLDDNAPQSVKFVVSLSNGNTAQKTIDGSVMVGKWGVACVPYGFNQCGLQGLVPDGIFPISYTVEVFTAAGTVVAPVRLVIDHRAIYEPYFLLFRNSIGGMQSIRLRGQVDLEADYDRQQAVRTVLPSQFLNQNLLAQNVTAHTEETKGFKGDTGFVVKPMIDDILGDLPLTSQLFNLVDNMLLPSVLVLKNAKLYSARDTLFSLHLEWQNAFTNQYFTQRGLVGKPAACPAMEKMVVKQKTKSTLQIMYSLPYPYDLAEFEIDNGTNVIKLRLNGNSGSVLVNFDNPAADHAVDITIRGRVVCDQDADPVDVGPFTTQVLSVTANSLPIANDDTYSIGDGYNSAVTLNGSVLNNDYDPDGDAIEVVAAAGATTQGGTYSINAAGIVQYTPPSSSFNGQDTFTYNIREVGGTTTVQATVRVIVGGAPIGVFAKLVLRNSVATGVPNNESYEGEYWIDFFSNPTGTAPLDITPYNLQINYRKTEFTQDHLTGNQNTSFTDTFIAGTGNKVKIYEGFLSHTVSDPTWDFSEVDTITFQILPGAGYVAI